jgi:hypothetical protein
LCSEAFMKDRNLWAWSLAASLFTLLLVALLAGPAMGQEAQPAGISTNSQPHAGTNSATLSVDISAAPARQIQFESPMPPNVRTNGAFAELVKIAKSGVDEKVMLALVTNLTSACNLTADEIVYLNDLGVPAAVVTAVIDQDQALKTPTSAQPAVAATGSNTAILPPLPLAVRQPEYQTASVAAADPAFAEKPEYAPFYDELSPYGAWVDVDGYGPCWQPTVSLMDPAWQPYFDAGHWEYTDCGWYWWSDYSWGWAPFHYGSWFQHNRLGWCWTPGASWSPSWVTWRINEGFCGWAPIPASTSFLAGAGLTSRGRKVQEHDDLGVPERHFRFVAWNHLLDHNLNQQALPDRQASQVFSRSTPVTRISGKGRWVNNDALPTSRLVSATRAPLRSIAVRQMGAPSGNNRSQKLEASGRFLTVYRPQLRDPRTAASAANGRFGARSINSPRAGARTSPWTGSPGGGGGAELGSVSAGMSSPEAPVYAMPAPSMPSMAPPSFGPPAQIVVPQNPYANPGPATTPLAPPVQLNMGGGMGGIYSAPAGWGPSLYRGR